MTQLYYYATRLLVIMCITSAILQLDCMQKDIIWPSFRNHPITFSKAKAAIQELSCNLKDIVTLLPQELQSLVVTLYLETLLFDEASKENYEYILSESDLSESGSMSWTRRIV